MFTDWRDTLDCGVSEMPTLNFERTDDPSVFNDKKNGKHVREIINATNRRKLTRLCCSYAHCYFMRQMTTRYQIIENAYRVWCVWDVPGSERFFLGRIPRSFGVPRFKSRPQCSWPAFCWRKSSPSTLWC